MTRNSAVDITRAIGIILVVLGHCPELPSPLVHFIFSFHMPLFFLLSGYLYRSKSVRDSLVKDARRLLVPYFVTCLVIIAFYVAVSLFTGELNSHVRSFIIATFVGSGTDHGCLWLSGLPNIGAIWFLPALFVCKNVYNLYGKLGTGKKLVISIVISIAATLIGYYLIYIPMSVLSGLSAIVFFAIGDALKPVKKIHPAVWAGGIACYVLSLLFSNIFLVVPEMDIYPLDVIGSTTMTILVFLLAGVIARFKKASAVLTWIGVNSLTILCFHILEQDCGVTHALTKVLGGTSVITFLCRSILPFIGTFVYLAIKKRASSLLASTRR